MSENTLSDSPFGIGTWRVGTRHPRMLHRRAWRPQTSVRQTSLRNTRPWETLCSSAKHVPGVRRGITAPRARRQRDHFRGERGSSDALGLALIAPAALGLAIVILFLGRGVDSRATVQVAAETGAQAAAQERTLGAAVSAGTAAATAMLVDDDTCSTPRVVVDTTQFAPGGVVSVTVSCTVSTRGLEMIDPPTRHSLIVATAIATIDPFRAAEGGPE